MSATVSQGLGITALGMALVFFTLGLVIVAMILLTRLPWLRVKQPAQEPQGAPAPAPTAATPARAAPALPAAAAAAASSAPKDDLARVAAIAVAVLRSRHGARARGPQPAAARSAWKSYGRAHQLGL